MCTSYSAISLQLLERWPKTHRFKCVWVSLNRIWLPVRLHWQTQTSAGVRVMDWAGDEICVKLMSDALISHATQRALLLHDSWPAVDQHSQPFRLVAQFVGENMQEREHETAFETHFSSLVLYFSVFHYIQHCMHASVLALMWCKLCFRSECELHFWGGFFNQDMEDEGYVLQRISTCLSGSVFIFKIYVFFYIKFELQDFRKMKSNEKESYFNERLQRQTYLKVFLFYLKYLFYFYFFIVYLLIQCPCGNNFNVI